MKQEISKYYKETSQLIKIPVVAGNVAVLNLIGNKKYFF